jgi:hypothetical protein
VGCTRVSTGETIFFSPTRPSRPDTDDVYSHCINISSKFICINYGVKVMIIVKTYTSYIEKLYGYLKKEKLAHENRKWKNHRLLLG